MRKHGRRDANQSPIVAAFERMGFSVLDLADMGDGCPDLLIARSKLTALVEVKSEHGTLEPLQVRFNARWNGRIFVVRNLADVEDVAARWFR